MPVWSKFISVRWIQIKRPLAQSDLDKKHQVSVQTSASEAACDAECHQNQMFGCVCVCVCTQLLVLLGSCYGLQSHRCPTLALVPASSDSPPAGNTQATYRLPKALTDKGEDVSYTGKVSVIQSVVKLNQSQQKGRYIYMFMANYYKSQSGSLQCREADTCGSISSPFYLCSFSLNVPHLPSFVITSMVLG